MKLRVIRDVCYIIDDMTASAKTGPATNPYQERMRERFYRILLEKNLKLTKPRKALIDLLLRKRGWHFQAEEVLHELNETNPGVVSRATVYRTLELMVESGILIKTRVHENSYRYELADTEGHHHHLVDINSGKWWNSAATRNCTGCSSASAPATDSRRTTTCWRSSAFSSASPASAAAEKLGPAINPSAGQRRRGNPAEIGTISYSESVAREVE